MDQSHRRTRPRAGRVPTWIPLALLAASWAGLLSILSSDVEAAGFARIDPRRTRIAGASGFVDARWRTFLGARLASIPEVSPLDGKGVQGIRGAIASLPFVAEVGEPRVLWPDGYEVPIRLRAPVACVRVRGEFLAVAEDGVILPGAWTRPPRVAGSWLPVVGPNDGSLDRARPGARLSERRHLDALATAASMRSALLPEDFEALGPPLIDASRARQASVEEPGIVFLLEGRRVVWFGRSPGCGEPGELPVERKWASLSLALKLLRPETGPVKDWSVLDVRWDVPDIGWRAASGEDGSPPVRAPRGG